MKSNINSKLIGGLLAALLATAISLEVPHAYAGDAEDKTKAAEEATGKAEKAKSDYDKAAAAEKAYEDAQKAAEAAEDDADQAKDALKKAEEDLKAAKNSGDKDKTKKAQDDRNKKDQEAKDAEKTEEQKKADRDKAKKEADEAAKKLDALRKAKREARKAARDANKAAKDAIEKMDKTNPDKDKLKEALDKIKERLSLFALGPQPAGSAALATLTASGKVEINIAGTGETIGHVADLKIQNLTDQPLTCAIPAMILESVSGKNQHYACPSGQTVALNPQQAKTVPMNGVCLNRNKPPVGKGVSGDLVMNEANPSGPQNPNSHLPATEAGKLLRSCAAKYTAADQLQKSGALNSLPYHDPQKQKDIVVQWSTWTDPEISQMTGSPPATKEDLRKVVYKQVEQQGPMSPEKKKKVDQGIDTIFEKVELTTAKAKELEKPEGENSPPAETPAD